MTTQTKEQQIKHWEYRIQRENIRLAYLDGLDEKRKKQGYIEEKINLEEERGFSKGRIDAYQEALKILAE